VSVRACASSHYIAQILGFQLSDKVTQADEIERLREALRIIAKGDGPYGHASAGELRQTAVLALAGFDTVAEMEAAQKKVK
jgi:hypothetical protein